MLHQLFFVVLFLLLRGLESIFPDVYGLDSILFTDSGSFMI